MTLETLPIAQAAARKTPLYKSLWVQVLDGIVVAVILGRLDPKAAIAMKPQGDAFIRLISMVITVVIFCTVVSGIAGMQDIKKVGRIGGKALLYFEVVSTVALMIGLVVGNTLHPGAGFNVNPATLDANSVTAYAGQAKAQSVTDFLLHIIPTTIVDAFAKGRYPAGAVCGDFVWLRAYAGGASLSADYGLHSGSGLRLSLMS